MTKRSLIAIAVMGAIYSSQGMAEIDGWDTAASGIQTDGGIDVGADARRAATQQNYFTSDGDYNIWVNPALINQYKGKAYGALGTYTGGTNAGVNDGSTTDLAGANIETGFGTIGLYLGRAYTGFLDATAAGPIEGLYSGGFGALDGSGVLGSNLVATAGASATPTNWFDLFYGMNMGDMDLGVRFNWASSSASVKGLTGAAGGGVTTSKNESSMSMRDINLAVGVKMKSLPIDASFSMGLPSMSDTESFAQTNGGGADSLEQAMETDGAMDLSFAARYELSKSKKSRTLISGFFSMENASVKLSQKEVVASATTIDDSDTIDSGTTGFGLYASQEMKPKAGVSVITSAGAIYSKNTIESKYTDNQAGTPLQNHDIATTSSISIPVSLSIEAKAKKNWTLRGSMARNLYSTGSATNETKLAGGVAPAPTGVVEGGVSTTPQAVSIALGASYMMGPLSIDATVNRDLLFEGPNVISGQSDPIAGQLSLVYNLK